MIQPNCRVQFTAEDVAFISTVLATKGGSAPSLVSLLTDSEARDLILDDDDLFRALLEQRRCLRVSAHFYFYVLVRHVFRRSGIEDRTVADYVAEVLSEFSHQQNTRCVVPGSDKPLDYLFEMLAALQTADDRMSFYIRAHIGNQSLFMSGVFPDRIRARSERRGFPNLRYYEDLGRANFRAASGHRLARKFDLAPIFEQLSVRFESTRMALNDLSDRIFSISDPELPVSLLKSLS
ncbi:MAG TPA: hypothetical protein VG754_11260 [Verrucomicrobiae bacterium]|nr:hypothetical protein [Verrucomicrobiae bacterium]